MKEREKNLISLVISYDELAKYIENSQSNVQIVEIDDNMLHSDSQNDKFEKDFDQNNLRTKFITNDKKIIVCENESASYIYFRSKTESELNQLLQNSSSMMLQSLKNNKGIFSLTDEENKAISIFFESEEEQELNYLFDGISTMKIKDITNYKGNKKLITFENNSQKVYQIFIDNYSYIKNKAYFKKLKKKIQEFNIISLTKQLKNKLKDSKGFSLIIAGGLITAATVVTTITASYPDFSKMGIKAETYSSSYDTDFIIPEGEEPIKDEPLNFDSNSSINIEIPEEENSQTPTELPNNDKVIDYDTTDFSILKDFDNYDDYIRFAAKLYYLDYETAKKVVAQNLESFTSPYKNDGSELDRMKDLKQKGIIDGDLTVMGIFISIKNYTLDTLNDQNPIISNKTNEEREADLINIARYIYGINDEEMLKSIIAIHRTETGYGKAAIATEHNNLGGIIDSSSDYNNPKHYIYKTTEIGAESAIRNYLIVFDKCFYNDKCDSTKPIPAFLANLYCTHTPKEWEATVSELMEDVDITKYVNSENKSY